MNVAISQDMLVKPNAENDLDLPGLEQVYYHQTFVKVINELEAPKSHKSDFGGYNYRSAEDINAALKPILLKYKCSIIMRKFDTNDGFEIYAYIVFKDQKYIRCEVPGVATYDFANDLKKNSKISKTQQYAAYQSYAKKYALSNLLLIDDSQNDLDAMTNKNIENEHQQSNKQKYRNPQDNHVATQADCDRAKKQIEDLQNSTPLPQAIQFFDSVLAQLPEFYNVLNDACRKKYAEIEQYFNSTQQQNAPPNPVGSEQHVRITTKQRDQLLTFIGEHGLDTKSVCEYLAIDSLMQIHPMNISQVKAEIEQLARREMQA